MTDTDTSSSPAPKKAKKTKGTSSHPKVSNMVLAAIGNLKERGGSSLQAIKKYVAATYKVDADKLAPFVKKYLRNAVTDGTLIQTKGKGATGSFKLSSGKQTSGGGSGERQVGRPRKKAAEQKKTTTEKKKSAEKKLTAKPKKVKEGKKEKKAKVSKKPKTPKPKKASAKKNTPKKK